MWEPTSHWDEHPLHTVVDWMSEVANDHTRQSYAEWVNSQLEQYKQDKPTAK